MKVRCFKMWKWLQTLRQGKWLNKKLSWASSTASPLTPPSVSMCNLNLSLDRRKGRLAPTFLLPAPSLCGNSLVGVCDISNWAVTFQGHSLGLSFPIPAQFTCFWVKSSRTLIFATHFPPYEPLPRRVLHVLECLWDLGLSWGGWMCLSWTRNLTMAFGEGSGLWGSVHFLESLEDFLWLDFEDHLNQFLYLILFRGCSTLFFSRVTLSKASCPYSCMLPRLLP